MATVVLQDLCKTFGDRRAFLQGNRSPIPPEPLGQGQPGSGQVTVLDRLNLTVQDGEFLVLVGPSGCGKSTLLRLIAGLDQPTSGQILINDRCVNDRPPKARDIAMVFQNYALYPHLTVYDNLAFGLRRLPQGLDQGSHYPPRLEQSLVGLSRLLPKPWRYRSPQEKALQERVLRVAHMLQVEHLLQRRPKELSGGQKQRVALGRAIARNPQVFLMDEPLSNLDAQLRGETRAQIVQLQQQLGVTTLYVTHDQVEAMTMGQRIAVLNQGILQQVDTPLNLYNRPANRFVAEFIGSPPMNFLPVYLKPPGTLLHSTFRSTLSDTAIQALAQSLKPPILENDRTGTAQGSCPYPLIWLGIRPEHLSLGPPAVKNIPGVVQRLENLGSVTDLTVEIWPQDAQDYGEALGAAFDALQPLPLLQVRIPADQRVSIGEQVHLAFRHDRLHLFDPHTHDRLA